MRSDAPPLMPIFRSRHQAELLMWLLLHPDREYAMTELARRLRDPLTTLHREAQRLVDASLLRSRSVGRSRLLQANPEHTCDDANVPAPTVGREPQPLTPFASTRVSTRAGGH